MKKGLLLLPILLVALPVSGQLEKDPEAKKILDRFSRKATGDYPLQIRFDYIYESLPDNQKQEESGSLILDREKFRLRFGEADVYCDGTTVWNHLTIAGEVYISNADEASGDEDFFMSNPADLFTFYRENFKYQLKGEIEYEDQRYYEINLYPENLDGSYHTIKLLIGSDDSRLHSAEAFGKNGVNHTVIVRDYKPKVKTDENTFIFRPEEHPDIEIIDTRL